MAAVRHRLTKAGSSSLTETACFFRPTPLLPQAVIYFSLFRMHPLRLLALRHQHPPHVCGCGSARTPRQPTGNGCTRAKAVRRYRPTVAPAVLALLAQAGTSLAELDALGGCGPGLFTGCAPPPPCPGGWPRHPPAPATPTACQAGAVGRYPAGRGRRGPPPALPARFGPGPLLIHPASAPTACTITAPARCPHGRGVRRHLPVPRHQLTPGHPAGRPAGCSGRDWPGCWTICQATRPTPACWRAMCSRAASAFPHQRLRVVAMPTAAALLRLPPACWPRAGHPAAQAQPVHACATAARDHRRTRHPPHHPLLTPPQP